MFQAKQISLGIESDDSTRLSTPQRGVKRVMSIEVVDASGNQITSFGGGTGGGDGAIVDGASSSIRATVFDLTSSNPLAVGIVDTNGGQVLPALETGGNLATIAGKDFATQTTLALIKAKTDNLDVTLSGGSQQTKITDGTNVTNVLKSDGTAAGQNAQIVGGTYLSVPFSSSTVQALASIDVGNYRYVSVQIISAGTGGVANFQTSNDNSTWAACSLVRSGLNTGATETSLNSANIDYGVVPGRYFRLNITGISGGTLSGVMHFSTIPGTQHTSGATINGTVTGSIAHDSGATNTSPLLVGAYASVAAPADVSADNDSVRVWALRNGQIVVQPGFAGVLASAGNGASGAGVQRVTIASDSTGVVGLNTGTNSIGKISDITTSITPGTGATNLGKAEDAGHTSGDVGVMMLGVRNEGHDDFSGTDKDYVPIATDATGDVFVNLRHSLPAGTAAIGKLAANSGVDIGDVDVTSISSGTNLIGDVGIQPRTTNGLDTFMASGSDGSSILVATAQSVKASAGKVYGYYIFNPEAAVSYVHFYNVASGSVTVGTTNPLFTLPIPAGAAANLGITDMGVTFSTAISIAATTTAGGSTAPATGVSAVIWFK